MDFAEVMKHTTGQRVEPIDDRNSKIPVIRHVQQLCRKSQFPFFKQKGLVGPDIHATVSGQSDQVALAGEKQIGALRAKETGNGNAATVTPLAAHVESAGK